MCKDSRVIASSGGGDKNGGGKGGLYSQKVKRQKVPKRGPGVAELEKLLREQKQGFGAIRNSSDQDHSLVKFLSNSHQPLSNSSCKSLPFGPNQRDGGKSSGGLVWPDVPKMLVPFEANFSSDENDRSIYRLPLPSFSSNGSNVKTNNLFPSPNSLKEIGQCYPLTSGQYFPDFGLKVPSSSCVQGSGGGVSDIGLEPPSSQISQYYCSNSVWPQEDKLGETSMTFPYLKEIPPVPPFLHKIQAFSSLACGNQARNFFNPEPTETASRNSKADCSPGPSYRNCYVDHGASDEKLFILGSSTMTRPWTMVPPRTNESKLSHLYVQELMEEEQQRCRLNQERPFLSFLTMEHTGMAEKWCSLSNEKAEANSDVVDLDLRL